MREQAYRCFEIVAWPALAWYGFEAAAEAATGEWAKAPWSAAMVIMAAAMVVGARWRAAVLRGPGRPAGSPA